MQQSILLFDSGCNLCNSSVAFVKKGDKHHQILQYPIRSAEGQEVLQLYPYLLNVDSIIYIQENKVYIKSDAVIEIAKKLSFPYKFISYGRFVPVAWRNKMYNWIAKNRYAWFGKIS